MAGKSSSLKQLRRGREVDHGQRAPHGQGLVLVVALHHALPDVPEAPPKPTIIPGHAVALLLVAHHPRTLNQRSLSNAPPRQASLPLRPPPRPLREPPSPAPVHALVLVHVLLRLTVSVKGCFTFFFFFFFPGIKSKHTSFQH